MSKTSPKRLRLGERDLKILRFLADERMSWLDPIHARFYRSLSMEAARSTMRRLCGRTPNFRFVRIDQPDGNRNFFRLTKRGAKLIGAPVGVTAPLGRTAFLRRFALQWFLEVDGQTSRWGCNPRDFPDLFAIKGDRLPRANFYFEESEEGTMLGFAIEDYGSDTRRVSRRAIDLLERFLAKHWFDQLFIAKRFAVTFLVATSNKATAIEKQFERDCQRRLAPVLKHLGGSSSMARIRVDCRVVPGLLTLIPTAETRDGE